MLCASDSPHVFHCDTEKRCCHYFCEGAVGSNLCQGLREGDLCVFDNGWNFSSIPFAIECKGGKHVRTPWPQDAGTSRDGAARDAGAPDGGVHDGGAQDGGAQDDGARG
jgi:hypothetical protein